MLDTTINHGLDRYEHTCAHIFYWHSSNFTYSLIFWWFHICRNWKYRFGFSTHTQVLVVTPEKTNYYAFAFKTCSGKSILNEPAILVSSDLEDRAIRLIQDIPEGNCFITGALIKASDPNTVSFTIAPTDKDLKTSVDLGQKNIQLRTELLQKSQELSKLLSEPEPKDFDRKFIKLTEDIRDLREKLGIAKSVFK